MMTMSQASRLIWTGRRGVAGSVRLEGTPPSWSRRSTSATSRPPSSSWLIWLEWLPPRGERPGPRLAGVGRPPLLGARPPSSASPPTPFRGPGRQTNRPAVLGEASTLVDEATACLWGSGGGTALDYLRGRGLTEAAVRAAGLGFTPAVMIPTRAGDRCFRFSGIVITPPRKSACKLRRTAQPKSATACRMPAI